VRNLPPPRLTRFASIRADLPRKLRIGMAFCAAIATAVLVGACGSGVPGDAVAVVGQAKISKAAFAHWETVENDAVQLSSGTKAPPLPVAPDYTACINSLKKQATTSSESAGQLKAACKQDLTGLTNQVMSYLIEAIWVQGVAHEDHVTVTAKQLAHGFATQRKTNKLQTKKALNHFLAASGQTVGDLRWRTYLNLLATAIQSKLVKKAQKVSTAQIDAYYRKNHSQFVTPETVNLHLIETASASTAATVKSKLAAGQSYATLAKKYSIDPTTKKAGGEEAGVRPGQLTTQLNAAVFKAKVGVLTGPIKTPFGYYIFTVDSTTKPATQSLKTATPIIKATIQGKNEQAANNKLNNELKTKWVGLTKCASGYEVTGYCGNAPKPTTTSSSTTATQTSSG
jgi:parvulin-like peptidyl-prolyl isomerase